MSDDQEPTGEEAEAQREETAMPLVWGGLGVLLIVGFIAAVIIGGNPGKTPTHPVIAPAEAPPTPRR